MGIICFSCCDKVHTDKNHNETNPNDTPRSAGSKDRLIDLKNRKKQNEEDFKNYSSPDIIKAGISTNLSLSKMSIADKDFTVKPENFISQNTNNPADSYEKISFLGEGGFSQVFKVRHKITSDYRAMKVIKRQSLNSCMNETSIFDEINILKTLDHPNIIKIYEFFQDLRNFYLITEYCEHGDLADNLVDDNNKLNVFLTESVVCDIMKQLLSAIIYLHSQNVIHGDLKLENILVSNKSNSSKDLNYHRNMEIKLIDFGCSRFFKKDNALTDQINGTINYIAPEALQGNLDKKNDIWSCGIIMYILLSGEFPFIGKSDTETIDLIEKGDYCFKPNSFNKISNDAKDLIKLLMTFDYKTRIDAKTALKHKWFKNKLEINLIKKEYLVEAMNNIKNFRNEHKFQQAVYTYITHNLIAKEDIENLRKIFKQLDLDGNGRISKDELQKGFKDSRGSILGELEIQNLMKSIDNDNNGYIEYEEFLKAALGNSNLLTNENLIQAFNVFDKDKSGDISADEIRSIIGGETGIEDEAFNNFLNEIGLRNGECMNFEKFKNLLLNKLRRRHSSYIR